ERGAVQRLDVGEDLIHVDAAGVDGARCQAIKHERIVRIRTVRDGDSHLITLFRLKAEAAGTPFRLKAEATGTLFRLKAEATGTPFRLKAEAAGTLFRLKAEATGTPFRLKAEATGPLLSYGTSL